MVFRVRNNSFNSLQATGEQGPYNHFTGVWAGPTHKDDVYVTQLRYMSDHVTPNFRYRRLKGEVFSQPMVQRRRTATFTGGSIWLYRKSDGVGYRRFGTYGDNIVTSGDLREASSVRYDNEGKGMAATAAYSKVGNPQLSSFVSLLESPETWQFLAAPFKRARATTARWEAYLNWRKRYIDRYLRYLKAKARYDRLPLKKRLGRQAPTRKGFRLDEQFMFGKVGVSDVASAWLAYRYGLMPVIYDTTAAITSTMARPLEAPRERASGSYKKTWTESVSESLGPFGFGDIHRIVGETKFKVEYRAGVLYVPYGTILHRYGLTPDQIPVALWEATKLSFVVDWFYNVGDYLNALGASCRANILAAWVVSDRTWVHNVRYFSHTESPSEVVRVEGVPRFTEEGKAIVREPMNESFPVLGARIELSVPRYADGFSLLYQKTVSLDKVARNIHNLERKLKISF